MPVRFLPPPDFPRLSEEARALAAEPAPDPLPPGWMSGFELEAVAAETLHGLLGLPLAANGDPRALMVVAEQINFRLAAGYDHGTKGSEQTGAQAAVVARHPKSGEAHALSPVAKELAAQLLAEYATAAEQIGQAPGYLPGHSNLVILW